MNDGKWSLPGGWADVGYTPKEVIIKEFKEETGIDIIPERLLAVFDKRKHPHPPRTILRVQNGFPLHSNFNRN
jgi:ADP-ribose pyrophosphatase YjhB (NUDIX family)